MMDGRVNTEQCKPLVMRENPTRRLRRTPKTPLISFCVAQYRVTNREPTAETGSVEELEGAPWIQTHQSWSQAVYSSI